jgi:hypothetical protein
MGSPEWVHRKDSEQLARVLELVALADLDDREWTAVRLALLAAWPARQDVSDWAQPPWDPKVAAVEADMDVPEV